MIVKKFKFLRKPGYEKGKWSFVGFIKYKRIKEIVQQKIKE